jgi:hypothetical protein
MLRSRLTVAILLYVSLDLTNPFIPGAFRFDPDASVEGVQLKHEVRHPLAAARWVPESTEASAPQRARPGWGAASPAGRRRQDDWLIGLRRAHGPGSDPAPPSDDH